MNAQNEKCKQTLIFKIKIPKAEIQYILKRKNRTLISQGCPVTIPPHTLSFIKLRFVKPGLAHVVALI